MLQAFQKPKYIREQYQRAVVNTIIKMKSSANHPFNSD